MCIIRSVKPKINLTALAIVVLAIIVYLPTSEAQEDPFLDNVLYSKDSEESSTVVLSGRDNATNYRYLILDDIRVPEMFEVWRMIDSPKIDATTFGHWSGTGIVNISEGLKIKKCSLS